MVILLALAALITVVASTSVNVTLQNSTIVHGMIKYGVPTFLGIPYAQPPKGKLRFADPQPVELGMSIDATEKPNICMQPKDPATNFTMSEDCLYLNIYSPNVAGSNPVMFFIHGGGYNVGTANLYPGTMFAMRHDIVVVATNYRLGPFGFFYDHPGGVKGNMGLKDQLMALKWVKANIAAFGGDPDRITVFGESAGSASVSQHLLSPMSKGLFIRAILESGTTLNSWAYNPPNVALDASTRLIDSACAKDKRTLECLRGLSAQQVSDAGEKLYVIGINTFAPTTDGEFIPDDPRKLIRDGKYADVDIIIGFNEGEGWAAVPTYWAEFLKLSDNGTDPSFATTDEVYVNGATAVAKLDPAVTSRCVLEAAVQEYSQWYPPTTALKRTLAVGDLESDLFIKLGVFPFAKNAKGKVYMYEFNYVSNYTITSIGGDAGWTWMPAVHGSELFLVFGGPHHPEPGAVPPTEDDKMVSDHFMELWTTFARNGSVPSYWTDFNSGDEPYHTINANTSENVLNYPRWQQRRFWTDYVPKLRLLECRNASESTTPVPLHTTTKATSRHAPCFFNWLALISALGFLVHIVQ